MDEFTNFQICFERYDNVNRLPLLLITCMVTFFNSTSSINIQYRSAKGTLGRTDRE